MKTLTKSDAEYISKRFYDFHDAVWQIIKEMIEIKNFIDNISERKGNTHLNYYCFARHDKNIIIANLYSSFTSDTEIRFPLHYLHDDNWQEEYRAKLIAEKRETKQSIENYNKERDLNEIKRLKKLYPNEFITSETLP